MPGRVFILGAGASREDTKHAKLPMPLANDFFLAEYINEHWHSPDYGYTFAESNLASILSRYFGLQFAIDGEKVLSNKSVNIEEVLTFLDNYENVYLATNYQKDIFIKAKQELLSFIHYVILNTPAHCSPEFVHRLSNNKSDGALKKKQIRRAIAAFRMHNAILSNIKREDSVISFNWDLIVDSILWANKKEHYFHMRDQLLNPFIIAHRGAPDFGYFSADDLHQGYFLKLHGSVNMACCTNRDCLRHQFPILFDEFEAETPSLQQCNICFSPLEVLILPPLVNKTYRSNRFFRLQAGLAASKLNIATEIIVLGYSFPVFDFEANSLMRLARLNPKEEEAGSEDFLERIIIVNPQVTNRRYIKRITDLFGLSHSKRMHGHKVQLLLYKKIDDFIENFMKGKK